MADFPEATGSRPVLVPPVLRHAGLVCVWGGVGGDCGDGGGGSSLQSASANPGLSALFHPQPSAWASGCGGVQPLTASTALGPAPTSAPIWWHMVVSREKCGGLLKSWTHHDAQGDGKRSEGVAYKGGRWFRCKGRFEYSRPPLFMSNPFTHPPHIQTPFIATHTPLHLGPPVSYRDPKPNYIPKHH